MKKFKSNGFTLIELLVVISIIGLMASIVLASLNSARQKASIAAIQANLSNVKPQAELQYDTVGCYTNTGTTCTATVAFNGVCPEVGEAVQNIFGQATVAAQIAAAKASGDIAVCGSTTGGIKYAISVSYKNDPSERAWCIDSSGKSKEITTGGSSETFVQRVELGTCPP